MLMQAEERGESETGLENEQTIVTTDFVSPQHKRVAQGKKPLI